MPPRIITTEEGALERLLAKLLLVARISVNRLVPCRLYLVVLSVSKLFPLQMPAVSVSSHVYVKMEETMLEYMANLSCFPSKVHYYTDSACTKGDTIGVVGSCEQASAPFVATNVICPV